MIASKSILNLLVACALTSAMGLASAQRYDARELAASYDSYREARHHEELLTLRDLVELASRSPQGAAGSRLWGVVRDKFVTNQPQRPQTPEWPERGPWLRPVNAGPAFTGVDFGHNAAPPPSPPPRPQPDTPGVHPPPLRIWSRPAGPSQPGSNQPNPRPGSPEAPSRPGSPSPPPSPPGTPNAHPSGPGTPNAPPSGPGTTSPPASRPATPGPVEPPADPGAGKRSKSGKANSKGAAKSAFVSKKSAQVRSVPAKKAGVNSKAGIKKQVVSKKPVATRKAPIAKERVASAKFSAAKRK